MYLVLGSVAVTTTVVALGMRRQLFTSDHQLRTLATTRQTPRKG
jgi:putative ABC transport system permease protein